MPYLSIQTNKALDSSEINDFIDKASKTVAQQLGKPESYVMVAMPESSAMMFAGNNAACAYLELKSLGLPEDDTRKISAALCELVQNSLGIDSKRIYIEFASPPRHMWGWDNSTF